MKRKLLFAMLCIVSVLGLRAQLTDGTVYWIQDTSTGEFLSQGADWGTQVAVKPVGGLGLEAVYVSEGKYKLKNIMWNKVNSADRGLRGGDGYLDQAPTELELIASGDGYLIKNHLGYYLANNQSANAYGVKPRGFVETASEATVWKFLTKTEYDAAIQAYKDSKAVNFASTLGYTVAGASDLESLITNPDQFISKDMTSSISNPTLSSAWTDWTHGKPNQRAEGAGIGSGCAEFWNGCGYATQTVSGLPNGLYRVDFVGTFRPQNKDEALRLTSENTSSPAFVSANETSVEFLHWIDVAAQANGRSGIVKPAYNNTLYTYVTDGTLKITVVQDVWFDKNMWCPFGQFTLTYYSDQVTDEEASALLATIPTAKMSDATQEALNDAKDAFEANKTIANYNALSAAIDAAKVSIAEYAIIASGTVPTNTDAGWAVSTTNGTLACNTWSTEGNSDGSGMTTPFIQDWVASGTPLAGGNAGGKLYYTFTDLTPGETYVVTALVRAFNESGTGVAGATYFVGSNSKSLETFGAACTGDYAAKGKFATLSCAGTVDSNGQLQFGIELDDDSPVNWVAIKNVTIATGTGDVPTAITMSQTSATLTTGSTIALTTTITPSTSDDKTTLWTSSDPTVATVSGGTVVALKAGTATITATAYAGDDVTATCIVTVADAAAPTYYTTTIAAEDYYIVNAATGKYLGGGNAWGTQASLIEHGIPFGATVGEGVYTLDSYTYNNATEHFLSGTYVDGASTNLYITALGSGKYSISTADGSAFLTATAGSTVVANTAANATSSLAQWYFLSKKDRDKALAAATALNPADATYYIKQANISRNRSAGALNVNAWSQYNVEGTQDNSNFAGQVYNAAVDNYQTIENIPNGTYTVTVQAFTSGTDVKFYANDQKVAVRNNDSGVGSCSGAAALFAQKLYPNTVTVTVTNRTLKIGFEGDCSSAKWLCYDDFELYMTGYTANTGVSASIDKDEFQIGETATITAATVPATASFNALTYTSSNEAIATVDANGVVTGVAEGDATITITANEMENFSTTVDVTVTVIPPTAIALSETTLDLDKETTSATLTVSPTPANATPAVTWTSSDPSVATVAAGVVTAVSTGSATITATSVVDAGITATCEVTVTFPESEYPASYYVNDGATRTITTLGENLIKNGSFEYPNAVYGWKTVGYTTDAVASNFTVNATGGVNDGAYITTNGAGVGSDKTLRRAIPVEIGKKYYFCVYTSGKAPSSGNFQYNALFKMSDAVTESGTIKQFEWPQGAEKTTTEWSKTECTFTAETPYVGVRMGWNSSTSFDNFVLAEVEETTVGNVQYALDAIPTANIGTGAFQYSQDAIDAAGALVQGTATVEDVEDAYEAVTTINAPEDGQLFNVVLTYAGWTYDNKALTYLANDRNDMGNYNIQYKEAANQNLAQAFTFTKVSGNNYKMSQIDADGNARYVCTGVPYSGNTAQIRTTTDASKALSVTVIPTATEGVYNLRNTEANQYIGSQDAGMYTVNSHINFHIVETTKPSIEINTTAAGWGTVMLPFAVDALPEGVKAYTCAAVNEATSRVAMEEVTALEANKPYIIEGSWNETLTGDAQGTALTYTEGYLTGVYANQAAPVGSYVMQKQGGKVAFYIVEDGHQPTVKTNRAYLTVPAGMSVKAFFLDDDATGINGVEMINTDEVIYNMAGQRVSKATRGVYIINGKKVLVK